MKVNDIVRNYKGKLRAVSNAAALEVSTRTITRTPIASGQARKNWFPSIGTPIRAIDPMQIITRAGVKNARAVDRLRSSGIPVQSPEAVSDVLDRMKPGDVFWLTNSLPYARRLEYGWSKNQAPQGMMRISVAEWGQIVREKSRER
jgi:hypothetical protein